MAGLHATTADNASLLTILKVRVRISRYLARPLTLTLALPLPLTILKSLHPDEWANLTERIDLVDRTTMHGSSSSSRRSSSRSSSSSSSSSSSDRGGSSSASLHTHAHEAGLQATRDGGDGKRVAAKERQRPHPNPNPNPTPNPNPSPSPSPNPSPSPSPSPNPKQERQEQAIEQWASDRSQVLGRTVRGMMRYGEALDALAL